jgi:hypothetical protein
LLVLVEDADIVGFRLVNAALKAGHVAVLGESGTPRT